MATDGGFATFVSGYSNRAAGNVTTHAATGLTAETTYYYRLRAQNAYGDSTNSNTSVTNTAGYGPTTINIDFTSNGGNYSGSAAAPTAGTVWNVIGAEGAYANLSNSWGTATTVSIGVPSGIFESTGNRSSPGEPGPALMIDYWRKWQSGNPVGGDFVLSGLDPSKQYDLYLYGFADTLGYLAPYATPLRSFVDGVEQQTLRGSEVQGEHAWTINYDYLVYSNVVPSSGGGITVTISNAVGFANAFISGLQLVEKAASTPAAPVATAASSLAATSFNANWNSSAGATNYLLDVATDNGFGAFVGGYSNRSVGLVTSHSVTGLSASAAYHYRVRAQNAAGISPYSNTITTNTLALDAPAAPVATAATDVTPTSLYANWSASAGATNYLLDVATDSGFTAHVSGYSNRLAGNVTTCSVTGLTAAATYYYRVRAENAYGIGTNSNVIVTNTPPRGWPVVNVDLGTGGGYTGTAGAPDYGACWNNFTAVGAHANLSNSYGAATTIGLLVPGGGNATLDSSASRAGDGSPCSALMTDHWRAWNEERTFTISGLNPARLYDLYLYAAADTVNNGPDLGNQAFTLNGVTNATTGAVGAHALTQGVDYVVFEEVTPNASSQIVFTVNLKPARSSFLSGLQLVEKVPPPKGSVFTLR